MNKSLTVPKFPDFVDILGTPWKIAVLKNEEEPAFDRERADGLCSYNERLIKILDTTTSESLKHENQDYHNDYMKEILRHEIVHAFLYESGLGNCSISPRVAWAKNEEMVDWFANQGQKIYRAWEQCGCLRFMPPERYLEMKTGKKEEKEPYYSKREESIMEMWNNLPGPQPDHQ